MSLEWCRTLLSVTLTAMVAVLGRCPVTLWGS